MSNNPDKHLTPVAAVDDELYRVMIVDDSAVIRAFLTRALEGDAAIGVAASVSDGAMAIRALQRMTADVIVLDIEMPNMDGLTALPQLIALAPAVKVIIASTLTAKGADISLRALHAGAADYVTKPSSARELKSAQDFNRELVAKVKALAAAAVKAGSRKRAGLPREERAPPAAEAGKGAAGACGHAGPP
jgi:two-component system chemotaxis response regulator CheB